MIRFNVIYIFSTTTLPSASFFSCVCSKCIFSDVCVLRLCLVNQRHRRRLITIFVCAWGKGDYSDSNTCSLHCVLVICIYADRRPIHMLLPFSLLYLSVFVKRIRTHIMPQKYMCEPQPERHREHWAIYRHLSTMSTAKRRWTIYDKKKFSDVCMRSNSVADRPERLSLSLSFYHSHSHKCNWKPTHNSVSLMLHFQLSICLSYSDRSGTNRSVQRNVLVWS